MKATPDFSKEFSYLGKIYSFKKDIEADYPEPLINLLKADKGEKGNLLWKITQRVHFYIKLIFSNLTHDR